MRTIRRLIYSEVLRAVGFVTLAFLALFFFFDMVDQMGELNQGASRGYTVGYALLYVALQVPNHLYELLLKQLTAHNKNIDVSCAELVLHCLFVGICVTVAVHHFIPVGNDLIVGTLVYIVYTFPQIRR